MVRERAQNRTDLNADADIRDSVVFVFDVPSATATNTGRAINWRSCPHEPGVRKPRGPCMIAGGDVLLYAVSERDQARTDLNGDGDTADAVAEVRRLSDGLTTNLGYAANAKSALLALGNLGAVRISETAQNANLNGDTDARDLVMLVFDAATQTTYLLGQQAQELFLLEGTSVAYRTGERDQAADLNADGDQDDNVLQYDTF